MMLLDFILKLDATVQVALLGGIGAGFTAVCAFIVQALKPKTEKEQAEYGPKAVAIELADVDRLRMDRLVFVLEGLTDELKELRYELSRRK